MEFLNFLQEFVGGTGGAIPYAVVFGVLLACGLGIPLPEDISLIFGGFLVFEQQAALSLMMLTGYLGIIVGDSMIFYFGRRIGSKVGARPGGFFSRIVTPQKRARVEGLFKRHGEKIVMIARFLPGVRAVTYFTAGSVGMRYSHFVFFDSVAALGSAPALRLPGVSVRRPAGVPAPADRQGAARRHRRHRDPARRRRAHLSLASEARSEGERRGASSEGHERSNDAGFLGMCFKRVWPAPSSPRRRRPASWPHSSSLSRWYFDRRSSTASRRYSLWAMRVRRESSRS